MSSPTRPSPRVADPAFVDQVDGDAVHLELGDKGIDRSDPALHSLAPREELLEREAVVQRHHGGAVLNGSKQTRGRRAHPLGRRLGCDEIGPRGFELHELTHEGVVLRVGDLGIVEDVVAVRVVVDRGAKLLDALRRLILVHRSHERCSIRRPGRGRAQREPEGSLCYEPASARTPTTLSLSDVRSPLQRTRIAQEDQYAKSAGLRHTPREASFCGVGRSSRLHRARSPCRSRRPVAR